MHFFHYNVDAVIINKIYPEESMQGYFHIWILNQEKGLQEIKESFYMVPLFQLELLSKELRTVEHLRGAARQIFGDIDPSTVLFREQIFEIVSEEGKHIMKINLPYFDKEDMDMMQKGDELAIIIKNERRRFVLPDKLKSKDITGAQYVDGWLNVVFA